MGLSLCALRHNHHRNHASRSCAKPRLASPRLAPTPPHPRPSPLRPALATPCIVAAQYGFAELVRLLCEEGVDVDLQTRDGYSALHMACCSESFSSEIIELLLDNKSGCDVNLKDQYGSCPLHYLAGTGNTDLCLRLLQHGAEPLVPDDAGWSAVDYATSAHHHDLAQSLSELGEQGPPYRLSRPPSIDWSVDDPTVSPMRLRREEEAAVSWACPACTFENDPALAYCIMCQTHVAAGGPSPFLSAPGSGPASPEDVSRAATSSSGAPLSLSSMFPDDASEAQERRGEALAATTTAATADAGSTTAVVEPNLDQGFAVAQALRAQAYVLSVTFKDCVRSNYWVTRYIEVGSQVGSEVGVEVGGDILPSPIDL